VHRLIFVLTLIVTAVPGAQDRPLPDYATFAAAVKQRLATDEDRQTGYTYIERRENQKLDAAGRARQNTVKVFEIYPGLPGEEPYRRLIEEDGKPVAPAVLTKEDRERQQALEAYARRTTSAAGRDKEAARLGRERREYAAAVDDLFRVYDIRMVGRESIDGQDTIVATLTPLRVKAQTEDGKLMQHFKARAWISEADAELVRVDIEAVDDLAFGWGFLVRIHKGATATYLRRKVNNEAWLPAQVTWTGSARVLLLKQLRERGVATYSGYRKFTVDTSTTYSHVSQ
jgi:hypothetical protein